MFVNASLCKRSLGTRQWYYTGEKQSEGAGSGGTNKKQMKGLHRYTKVYE